MAAGLKVCCSILEGSVKSLKESPVKQLQGNELNPVILTRMGYTQKIINGFSGIYSGKYGVLFRENFPSSTIFYVPPPSTPYESFSRQWNLYSSFTQTYNCTGLGWDSSTGTEVTIGTAESFTGVSGLSGNCPTVSGYPSSSNPNSGTSTKWGPQKPSGMSDPYDKAIQSSLSDTSLNQKNWASYYGSPPYPPPNGYSLSTYDWVLSSAVDVSGVFSSCKSDLLSKSFSSTWATPYGDIYYKDYAANIGSNISGVSSSVYNSSIQSTGPTGVNLVLLGGIHASCGWMISSAGSAGLSTFKGQAKLSASGSSVPFWIGKASLMSPNQPWWDTSGTYSTNPGNFYTGTTDVWPIRSISFIREGTLTTSDLIAYESTGVFNLPFPTEIPFPIQSVSGSPIYSVFYFAVIGQDPAGWAKQNGYNFGTTTSRY